MKPLYPGLMAVALTAGLLGGCASDRFDGGVVPTSSEAISIANKLCPDPFRQRKGRWHAVLRDGVWKISRDMGRQSIRIDARSGKTEGCHSI